MRLKLVLPVVQEGPPLPLFGEREPETAASSTVVKEDDIMAG